MKHLYGLAGALVLAAGLGACGGGGGSTPSIPITQPTTAPAAQHRLVVSWSGANQSGTALAAMRRTLSSVQTTPVTLGAAPTFSPPPGAETLGPTTWNPNMAQAAITVSEVDANGSPVPVSSASVTVANPSVAQVGSPLPSPPANAQQFIASPATGSASSTSLTISTSDATGTTTAKVYQRLVLAGSNVYADAVHGYAFDGSGNATQLSSCTGADICIPAPVAGTPTQIRFPYGYVSVAGTAFANYLQAPVSFTSAGTALGPTDPSLNGNIVVFKTGLGNYVAIFAESTVCQGTAPACSNDADMVALFKWAPASGTFSQ